MKPKNMDAIVKDGIIRLPPPPPPDEYSILSNQSVYGWWQKNYYVEDLHRLGFLGERLTIAILDTGVNFLERIADQVVQRDNYTDEEGVLGDAHSHGTFIACQLAGQHDIFGFKGTTPRASILSKRVLNSEGIGRNTWIQSALESLLDTPMENGRFYLANLSLGGGYDSNIHDIQKALLQKGWYIFNAAGNDAHEGMGYPGANVSGISVGSINRQKQVSDFSSRALLGQDLDIMDGGEAITSYDKDGQQSTWNGTSMACPNALGKFGLCLERDYQSKRRFYTLPNYTEKEKIIEYATEDILADGKDRDSGSGIFQPQLLINWMESGFDLPEPPDCPSLKEQLRAIYTTERGLRKNLKSTLVRMVQLLELNIDTKQTKRQITNQIWSYLQD